MGHFVFVGITIHAEHYTLAVKNTHFFIFRAFNRENNYFIGVSRFL